MPAVEVNGTRLEYEAQGAGEPLVFVHGSLEDYRSWRFQAGPFAAHYHTIAYSRRYHYPNPPAPVDREYTAALHAGDLAGLIEALGLAPAHLVCSSFGGYVALCLAATRPELVRSLALTEPPVMPWLATLPGGPPLAADFLNHIWEPARRAFQGNDPEGGVRAFLNGVMGRPAFESLMPASRAQLMDNAPALKAETASHDYFSEFTPEDARRIECPALLIEGQYSPALFHILVDALAGCLPHNTRALIPGVSHAVHLGNPQAYNRAALAFLAGPALRA